MNSQKSREKTRVSVSNSRKSRVEREFFLSTLENREWKENFLLPLSKIESRKRNGKYQIFEIEREISLSTLDFLHKIEMPGLSSTRCIHRWTRNWGMPPILPLFDLAGGRANPLSVAAICTSPIKSRGDIFYPCCQTKISSVFSSSRCFCGDSCSIRAMFGLEGRMFKWPKRSDSCFVNPLSSILEKHL